jgi:hypothetical protein
MSTTEAETRTTPGNGAAPSLPDVGKRLEELREELRTGRERMLELEAENLRVRDTVLRIEGAIMALEELAGTGNAPPRPGPESSPV